MACARKWRELIAGRRWMVAGKWWCPGPCGGRRLTALGGHSWRGIEGFDTITHPQPTAGPVVGWSTFWASLELWDFLHFQPTCTFSLHITYGPLVKWDFLESRRVVFLLAVLSQMTNVWFSTYSSICFPFRQMKSNHAMDTFMTIIAKTQLLQPIQC